MSRDRSFRQPTPMLFFMEGGRAILRYGNLLSKLPELRKLPKGDDHPVFVMPGFMAGDFSTAPMRNFLKRQGYRAYPWRMGVNLGRDHYEDMIMERVMKLHKKYGRKLSLIGWSLGGVFAREVARKEPNLVRQVITLGSPFNGIDNVTNVGWLYELVNNKKITEIDPELIERIKQPIDVPTTNIYSKSDGVVPWQCCIDPEGPFRQNIEVNGAHVGLGHHPKVLACIADRLAQPEGQWAPYDPNRHAQF